MSLYEISERYFNFLQSIENEKIPEEEINNTLQSLDGEFDEKADSIACFIKNLKSETEAIKKEIITLNERRSTKLKCAERLTEYLQNQMEFIGKEKIETPRNQITIRKNPESVFLRKDFLDWAKENGEKFLKWKEPEPDKLKIKEFLKSGGKLDHAELIQIRRAEIK
ncbi:MAG: siphovirus Gp157 family protein [Oscillospiraceae bacterium]|jgi:hypothetical protein|nr:siphovirus Gp157 family protein [Oscillospiraceae bacterium]